MGDMQNGSSASSIMLPPSKIRKRIDLIKDRQSNPHTRAPRPNGSMNDMTQHPTNYPRCERTSLSLLVCSRAVIALTATATRVCGVSQARGMQSATAVDRNNWVEERPKYSSRKSLPEGCSSSIVLKGRETEYLAPRMFCSRSLQHSFAAIHVIDSEDCSGACAFRTRTGSAHGVQYSPDHF